MSDGFDKEAILSTITDGMKMKKQMLKKGIRSARVQCPKCDGPCKRQMME